MALVDFFFVFLGACALAVFILGLSGRWLEP